MQFLYPSFLWALFTLTIPIIIHLFNFRKYKTVYFSNVAFLQNIRKETRSRSTLKSLLLLLIRLLAIAFLVLAFARPFIPVNHSKKNGGTPRVAIYIDNSFSMEAEGKSGMLLEAAKMKSRQITEAFPYNTQYLIVTNNFELKHQQWVGKDQLIDWVSQVQSTHIFRTMNQVVDHIQSLLPVNDSLISLQVFLLSDFQKNTIDNKSNFSLSHSMFYAVPFHNNQTGNMLIDSVWFESPGHYVGKQEVLKVTVKNFSNEKYAEIPIQLYINDTLNSSVGFTIDSKSNQTVSIPFVRYGAGLNRLKVEISDYPITFDNSFYTNFTITQKNKVLIISGIEDANYFTALFKGDENFETTSVAIKNIPFNSFTDYNMIIVNEMVELPSGFISELTGYLKQGSCVVFIPNQNGSIADYNLFVAPLVHIRFSPWIVQQGRISEPDENSDLFEAAFKTSIKESRLPDYQGFYPFEYPKLSNFDAIYKSESGHNLFIRSKVEQGVLYLSALPINKSVTDLALHPIFVPLFYNIGLQSTSQAQPYYWLKPVTMAQIGLKAYSGENVQLTVGNENPDLMPRTFYQNGKLMIFPQTDQMIAGSYSIKLDGVEIDNISFNYDRRESDMSCYSESELKDIFGQLGIKQLALVNPEKSVLDNEVKNATEGKDLSQLFLWLVLAMFLIEIAVLKFSK